MVHWFIENKGCVLFMVLNVEEAKQKTIELVNKKVYSALRAPFSKYSSVFPNTTENLSYLEQMQVKEKEVLTVTGSFDQCLNCACLGAKKVHNIDTNVLTVFYAGFKYAALEAFSYQEYLAFFFEENKLNYTMYLKLRPYLGAPFQEYWDFVYQTFSYVGTKIAKSLLFKNFDLKKTMILSNPYLKSEENYERTKESMKKMEVTFAEKNILEIGEETTTYDIMLFSNVETYLVEDNLEPVMSKEEFLTFIQKKASKQLKPGGVIQSAYQYLYKCPRIQPLPKNVFKRLVTSKWSLQKIDYMEGKFKKIVFMGYPLRHKDMTEELMDCVYLYEDEKGRRR